MIRSFNEMHLSAPMLDAIARAGYTSPTPIQARAIGIALEGKDLIGCAQTGTGKTAAFAIPIIERLCASRPGAGARALVLAPTRELALQIAEHFAMLGGARGLRTVTLIGGEPMGPQLAGLARRPDVIVATPGRLFDHIERRSATLSSVRSVVLDEADRMLDMGFAPQVERILAVTPLDRQTLCFSATMPEEVERLVRKHLSRPERVEVGTVAKPVAAVTQRLYATDSTRKMPLLLQLLGEERGQTLVFTRTKHRADRLARAVAAAGHRVTRLHADRTMSQRREALDGRNREGGRLAGARLGAADEVLAFECDADGPRLDRRGRDVARARDGVEHGRAEVQLVERTDHLGSFTFLVGLDLRLLPGRYFEEHPGPPAGPGGSDRGRT